MGDGDPDARCVLIGPPERPLEIVRPRSNDGFVIVSPATCRPPKQSPVMESREWLATLTLPDIPIERPDEVWNALRQLLDSPRGKAYVRASLRRSGKLAPHVTAALAARRLPRALLALPLLESAWNEVAVSKAGATGLWQLMPATARRLGLVVTKEYDERRSPERSTEAALAHLGDLYAKFGNWDLALAAYDRGQPGIERALKKNAVGDYWSLVDLHALPEETRKYVAFFLALAILSENAARFDVEPDEREPTQGVSYVEVPAGTPLSLVARAAGTSVKRVHLLSPELLGAGQTPRFARVAIPAEGLGRARIMLPSLLSSFSSAGLDTFTAGAPFDFDWGRDERDRDPDPGPTHETSQTADAAQTLPSTLPPRWALGGSTHESS
jgi:membrane-bound lytic murein transglycosylase D